MAPKWPKMATRWSEGGLVAAAAATAAAAAVVVVAALVVYTYISPKLFENLSPII